MFFCKVKESRLAGDKGKNKFLGKIYIIFVKLMLKTLAKSEIVILTAFEGNYVM